MSMRGMSGSLRKVVATLACGPQVELLDLADAPLRDFATRHGYDVVVERAPRAPERPVSWSKVPLLLELMDSYDVVLWVDADAIFVDTSRDIADELEDGRFLYLVQHRYGGQDAANCGILMLRSCDEARDLLRRAWAMTEFVDHPWWEQGAILTLLGYEIGTNPATAHIVRPSVDFARTKILRSEWNSIAIDPAVRPRIKHYAGLPHDYRVAAMSADLEEFRRRRAAQELGPERFAATIVLPLASLGDAAWSGIESLAALPEEPAHEVVIVDDGSGRFEALVAALAGDVKIVRAAGGVAGAAAAALEVAEGEVVVLVEAPPVTDAAWLTGLLAELERAFATVRAVPVGDDSYIATTLALRRTDLAARGSLPSSSPGRELTALWAALQAEGRLTTIAAADALPPATLAAAA